MSQDLRQAFDMALECFNDPARRDQYLAGYAEDVVLHGFAPDLPPGKAGATAFYGMIWGAFPDATVTAEEVVVEGERVAARYRMRGTHQGEFMGIPASDRTIDVGGMTIIQFANGLITERWNQLDQLAVHQQLGVIPAGS